MKTIVIVYSIILLLILGSIYATHKFLLWVGWRVIDRLYLLFAVVFLILLIREYITSLVDLTKTDKSHFI